MALYLKTSGRLPSVNALVLQWKRIVNVENGCFNFFIKNDIHPQVTKRSRFVYILSVFHILGNSF